MVKIECIHLQLCACDKPPDLREKEFIGELENVLYSVDQSDPLFLSGDLYFNVDKSDFFNEFMISNGLKNYVNEPRIRTNFYQSKKDLKQN
jgi:hypothetical protein